jgi:alpha-tubulin suppressor-like RCC1 family protein
MQKSVFLIVSLIVAGSSVMLARDGSSASRVSAGGHHTCAVTDAGGDKCWGYNGNGQLGDGTTTERHSADFVDGLRRRVTSVAAGDLHSCDLTVAGAVKCWGWNFYGQLGDGTTAERHTPDFVDGLTRGITAIATGGHHTCALTTGGRVKCWGWNRNGQLGDGTTTDRHTPMNVDGLTHDVAAITVGLLHTCAVTAAHAVKCWGYNGDGQLGDGTPLDRHTPVFVDGLTHGVAAVSAGWYHTCALTQAGGVKCWGNNAAGQLGDGTTTERHTPVFVDGLRRGVIAIAAGGYYTCALTGAGGVKCWGDNKYGQLGDGTTTERHTPDFVDGLTHRVSEIAAGPFSACAMTNAGRVKCWGYNGNGQLGDGTTTDRHTPVFVDGF